MLTLLFEVKGKLKEFFFFLPAKRTLNSEILLGFQLSVVEIILGDRFPVTYLI